MMKKQLIMDSALELFAKQGFESTSVQQITDHCGISKGAFYLVFKSKDELILALLDHFMSQFTVEIDRTVKESENESLLYDFYYAAFDSFNKQSDFARFFIKEQTQSFNEEFLLKIQYYDRLLEKVIFSMIERLYGEKVNSIKYDLTYTIKGFIRTYSELFLFYTVPLDLHLLAHSLVEKTNLLAQHMTIPFITRELMQLCLNPETEEITKEQILKAINQKIEEFDECMERESLDLLRQHLLNPTFSNAIVIGLLENIRHHPQTKWVAYILRSYLKL